MKKTVTFLLLITVTLLLTGCDNNTDTVKGKLDKIKLTDDLVTYEAYYHNVIKYSKKAGTGITHLGENERKFFAEYSVIADLGIDLSDVEVKVNNNNINIKIPKAEIIGDLKPDYNDFDSKNFIESIDNSINKNPLDGNDSIKAYNQAQNELRETIEKDSKIKKIAQERAGKIVKEKYEELCKDSNLKCNIEVTLDN